jgi:hypothetical protein
VRTRLPAVGATLQHLLECVRGAGMCWLLFLLVSPGPVWCSAGCRWGVRWMFLSPSTSCSSLHVCLSALSVSLYVFIHVHRDIEREIHQYPQCLLQSIHSVTEYLPLHPLNSLPASTCLTSLRHLPAPDYPPSTHQHLHDHSSPPPSTHPHLSDLTPQPPSA